FQLISRRFIRGHLIESTSVFQTKNDHSHKEIVR
ncbi:MAG: hypothetical protein ACI8YI_002242, partial [Paracoccaceae bacterium]